jgi:hypothetical protein
MIKHEYKSRGYVYIYAPNHPKADCYGYVKRATLVAEQRLGRFLIDDELVHHKGARDDDRPEMLEVKDGQSQHAKEHHLGGRNSTTWVKGGNIPRGADFFTDETHRKLHIVAINKQRDAKGRFVHV